MTALLVMLLQIGACLGYGTIVIRVLALGRAFGPAELLAWAFVSGFGLLGWILFFVGWAGWFHGAGLITVLGIGAAGIAGLRGLKVGALPQPQGTADWLLIIAFATVGFGDLLEGLAPPADGDTLAYHYALPKQFVAAGALEFVPRAVDGAVPLLIQMTYVPVLALGGERALTLWSTITGWAAGALLFVFLGRYVRARSAAAATLVLLTTPAVLAGAGTGQVETRLAMFAIVAAAALADLVRTGDRRFAVLAGLMGGFYAASKYIGLLFVAALAAVTFARKDRFRTTMLLGAGAAIGGFQWYLWNWMRTGDPVFPMLVGGFGIGNTELWPADFHAWFQQMTIGDERAVARTPFWFFALPVYETFVGFPQFGGGRVGLGPFLAVALPLVVAGIWNRRTSILASPLFPAIMLASVFYVLWFVTGPSQRVRHLLPVYPLVLAAAVIALDRVTTDSRMVVPVIAAFAVTLTVQIAAQAVYSVNYVQHHSTGESRDDFLRRNVSHYEPVPWINANLRRNDRILVMSRQLSYLIDVPHFVGHLYDDPRIDLRPERSNTTQLMTSLRRFGITHVLAFGAATQGVSGQSFAAAAPWDAVVAAECLDLLQTFEIRSIESRTLNVFDQQTTNMAVFRVAPACS